ncbi:hypothetical protein [Actinacidiphila bryophytorum]|nr:hypothetical protein [Actinacidiphila bryophytorum]UWE11502.1 hypothetical protein NYE86_24170 [Actinacidiphila bryophytorum]
MAGSTLTDRTAALTEDGGGGGGGGSGAGTALAGEAPPGTGDRRRPRT